MNELIHNEWTTKYYRSCQYWARESRKIRARATKDVTSTGSPPCLWVAALIVASDSIVLEHSLGWWYPHTNWSPVLPKRSRKHIIQRNQYSTIVLALMMTLALVRIIRAISTCLWWFGVEKLCCYLSAQDTTGSAQRRTSNAEFFPPSFVAALSLSLLRIWGATLCAKVTLRLSPTSPYCAVAVLFLSIGMASSFDPFQL